MTQPPIPPVTPPPPPPLYAAPAAPATPAKRNWFVRNLAWLIPVGCLAMLCIVGTLVVGAVWFGYSQLRQMPPYRDAMDTARGNAEVRDALGEPIEAGVLVQFNVNLNNDTGHATMSIPLTGPKGKGTLRVEATKSAGQWSFDLLQLQVDGRKEPIDLLKKGTVV